MDRKLVKNRIVALSRTLLREFKKLAKGKDRSVSRLLREPKAEALRDEDSYERAYGRWREDMKNVRDLGTYGKINWTRDELHERRR